MISILIWNHLYLGDLILILKSSTYDDFAHLCAAVQANSLHKNKAIQILIFQITSSGKMFLHVAVSVVSCNDILQFSMKKENIFSQQGWLEYFNNQQKKENFLSNFISCLSGTLNLNSYLIECINPAPLLF